MVRVKRLLRLVNLGYFEFFFFLTSLNSLIPFLKGTEILYSRPSLNSIFISTLKLDQLFELSLSNYQDTFPFLRISGV